MANIKRLINTKDLKTDFLKKGNSNNQVNLRYDEIFDALNILFVDPSMETVTHYIDDHVALLYNPTNREIVGIQVEAFQHSFLNLHEDIKKVWRLTENCDDLDDFGDIILIFERKKPAVVKEVTRITESLLYEQGLLDCVPV